ncbi:MAG: hypothetical protein WAV56_03445 [Microgenomates group bacterium]
MIDDFEKPKRSSLEEGKRNTELIPQVTVEAWNTARIELPEGGEVSLEVDQDKLGVYLQSKLIPPFAPEGPTHWKYSFDLRPRPASGNPDFDYLAGLTIYNEATVFINVANLWNSLLEKNADNLLLEILKTVAHETNHVKQFLNTDMQKKAKLDRQGRDWWGNLGKFLGLGFSIGDGLIAGEIVRRKTRPIADKKQTALTRRDFLKLGAGATLGFMFGDKFSNTVEQGAFSVFDRYVDPSHTECYQAESRWAELKEIIKIREYIP